MIKKYFVLLLFLFINKIIFAQYDAPLYTSYTTNVERAKLHERLIKSIEKNLSKPLNDSTEESWQNAFDAIEVLQYKSPFSNEKINNAFKTIDERSIDFQKSLLEMIYSNYPNQFLTQVNHILYNTADTGVFTLCAVYLLQQNNLDIIKNVCNLLTSKFGEQVHSNPVLYMLQTELNNKLNEETFLPKKLYNNFFSKDFLKGNIIMYSLQRKNRDYPGLVIIKDKNGNFIKDSSGAIFNIPQLARSITNLPFYLHYGNTPQGIFFMHGFQVSMSNFIGPTANVQLSLPQETSIKNFLRDSITDTIWNFDLYKKLIPVSLQNYLPLYQTYYAGAAGRTEIIAHGTTIDPSFYLNKNYYPLTPSEGCLCTKEIWNGKRLQSDQQKLVNALLKAGGADGYCVVIELDDKQSAVTLNDVLPYLTGK